MKNIAKATLGKSLEEVKARIHAGAPSPAVTPKLGDIVFVDLSEKKTDRLRVSAEVDSEESPLISGNQSEVVPLPMRVKREMAGSMGRLTLLSTSKIDQSYLLRVTYAGQINATAGGVGEANIVSNPATFPFSEWTAFAALFDEVKLKSLVVDFWVYDPLAVSAGPPLCVTGSFHAYTATVTSVAQLANAGNSRLVSCVNTTKTSHKVALRGTNLNWATTSSPSPGPYAGCPGSVQLYGTGFTPSVAVGSYLVVLKLYLRGRL